MTSFSENRVLYPGSQESVIKPQESVMLSGFIPEVEGMPGQSLPANWLNWLFREIFRLFNRDVVSDETGVGLFKIEDSAIELIAFDKSDTSKYLHAVGWKGQNVAPVFNIISSSGLSLGTPTTDGNQPVSGGSNTVTIGKSRS